MIEAILTSTTDISLLRYRKKMNARVIYLREVKQNHKIKLLKHESGKSINRYVIFGMAY